MCQQNFGNFSIEHENATTRTRIMRTKDLDDRGNNRFHRKRTGIGHFLTREGPFTTENKTANDLNVLLHDLLVPSGFWLWFFTSKVHKLSDVFDSEMVFMTPILKQFTKEDRF